MNAFVTLIAALGAAQAQFLPAAYAGYGYGAPLAVAPQAYAPQAYAPQAFAPQVYAAPALPAPYTAPSSQYQAQDEFANFQYGYSNINSAKTEVGNAYGGVTGSYSYVDANGELQRTDYIADAGGFRVQATNLPVAPGNPEVALPVAPVYSGVAPTQVQDTDEVAEAKVKFFAAFEEAKNREKRSVVTPFGYGYPAAYGFAAPGVPTLAPVVADTPAATVKAVHAIQAPVYANYAPYAGNYGYAAAPFGYNGYASPFGYNSYAAPAPVAYAHTPVTYAAPAIAYAAPAVAAAPAVESTLTTIKLNPGHAVAYRVDK